MALKGWSQHLIGSNGGRGKKPC